MTQIEGHRFALNLSNLTLCNMWLHFFSLLYL